MQRSKDIIEEYRNIYGEEGLQIAYYKMVDLIIEYIGKYRGYDSYEYRYYVNLTKYEKNKDGRLYEISRMYDELISFKLL